MGSSNKKLSELVEGVEEFERIEILEPLAEMNTQGEGIRLQLVPVLVLSAWLRFLRSLSWHRASCIPAWFRT